MDKERKLQSFWKKTKPLISQSLGLLEELSMELGSCAIWHEVGTWT